MEAFGTRTNGIGAGLYGHEEQDAALYFNRWDFDFIKIDYCGAGQELDLEEQQRYTAISKAFQRASSKLVEVNICRWAFPGTWAKELARSNVRPTLPDAVAGDITSAMPYRSMPHQRRHQLQLGIGEAHHREKPTAIGLLPRRAL